MEKRSVVVAAVLIPKPSNSENVEIITNLDSPYARLPTTFKIFPRPSYQKTNMTSMAKVLH
jgi:hypothetical protein